MKGKAKKYLELFLFIFALVVGVFSPEIPTEAKTKYKLNKTSINLQKGTTYQLRSNYKGKKIKWSSKNKKVAVVDRKGKVTAKKDGSTYINCKIGKKTLKCKVRVFTAKMSVSKKTIYVNRDYQLKVKGYRVSKWKSSNKKIATVSKNGRVTGKKEGIARIYAYVGNSRLSSTITVKKKTTPKPIPPKPENPKPTPEYKYSLHILNNYKIYANDADANIVLYIKTNNPDPHRILVGPMYGSRACENFADVKYRNPSDGSYFSVPGRGALTVTGPMVLVPVQGGYITSIEPDKVGEQTYTIWELYKGASSAWYDVGRPELCSIKTEASVTFYAHDEKAGRRNFEDEVIENAKKNILVKQKYTIGEYKDLSENEKILLEACEYVKSTCTYPCNDFGYNEPWGYVSTLKRYGEWWDSRQVDSNIGPGLLMELATRLGADSAIPYGGDGHAYVAVMMNGNYYPYLTMTPYMDTGAINPDKIEFFDFSKFR